MPDSGNWKRPFEVSGGKGGDLALLEPVVSDGEFVFGGDGDIVTVFTGGYVTPGLTGDEGSTRDPGSDEQPQRFVQSSPASEWIIPHGFGGRPSVTVSDTSGVRVHGTVTYPTDSAVRIVFANSLAGEARLV